MSLKIGGGQASRTPTVVAASLGREFLTGLLGSEVGMVCVGQYCQHFPALRCDREGTWQDLPSQVDVLHSVYKSESQANSFVCLMF